MSLQNKATRAILSISEWSAKAPDKNIARKAETDNDAVAGTVTARKKLLPNCPEHDAVLKFNNALRMWHYEQTLPWDDAGGRVLPAGNVLHYMDTLRERIIEGEALVDAFVAVYPSYYEKARFDLGALFDEAVYPSPSFIRSKFSYRYSVEPIADLSQLKAFGNVFSDEDIEAAKQAEQARVAQAMDDVWARIHKQVSNAVLRLSTPIGEKGSVFQESLVTNAQELADLLPRLNLMGDPKLNDIANELKVTLASYNVGHLRTQPEYRESAAKEVTELAQRMKDYGFGNGL